MRTVHSIVAGLFAMLIGSTAWAAACDGFTDVDSAASYCTAVVYLKDHGITLGCTGTAYCPDAYVTRAQMALFLQRMGQADPTNVLGDYTTTIGGGISNTSNALGGGSTVGGGERNTASNTDSYVGGGYGNVASGYASAVPGGYQNTASGFVSFAAGQYASADQGNCAVFALWGGIGGIDCLGSTNVFRIGGQHGLTVDYFSRRADGGGTRFVAVGDLFNGQTIATWTGAFLSDGGAWTNASDRNSKTDVAPIDPTSVLDKVAALPIETWRYKVETDQIHLGPMAQDFRAAFGLGADDKHIATIDEGGVALAAIQGLNAKLEARDALIADQAHALALLQARVEILEHAPVH